MKQAATVVEKDNETLALEEVRQTESALAAATEKLQAFVREHFRVTPGGLIYQSHHKRDWLDGELRQMLIAVEKCRTKFHASLRTWSSLKLLNPSQRGGK